MPVPENKTLRFPNGSIIESNEIRHVNLYPALSLSRRVPYVKVFSRNGLFYEGLVDLDRVDAGIAARIPA
jgi:hypothetical protein